MSLWKIALAITPMWIGLGFVWFTLWRGWKRQQAIVRRIRARGHWIVTIGGDSAEPDVWVPGTED